MRQWAGLHHSFCLGKWATQLCPLLLLLSYFTTRCLSGVGLSLHSFFWVVVTKHNERMMAVSWKLTHSLLNISLHQIQFFFYLSATVERLGVQLTLYYTAQETGNGILVMMYEDRGVSTLGRKVALIHFLLLAGGPLLYNNEKSEDLLTIHTYPHRSCWHVVLHQRWPMGSHFEHCSSRFSVT